MSLKTKNEFDRLPHILLSIVTLSFFSGQMIVVMFALLCLYIMTSNQDALKSSIIELRQQRNNPELIIFTIFCLFNFATSIWSLNAGKSLETALKILIIVASGYLAASIIRKNTDKPAINSNQIIIYMFIINIILLIEHLTSYSITIFLRKSLNLSTRIMEPLDRGTALFTIMLPYLYLYSYQKSLKFGLLILVTIINYIIHPMCSALVAVLIIVATAIAYFIFKKRTGTIIYTLSSLLLLSAPIFFSSILKLSFTQQYVIPKLPLSWLYRVQMWEKAAMLIKARPLTGYGINSSNYTNQLKEFLPQYEIQLHPHNAFLQIWLETGLIGAMLVSCLFYFFYLNIQQINQPQIYLATICSVTALLTFSLISFGLWQSWFLCAIGLVYIIRTMFLKIYT